ncbi:Maf family protein [Anaerorhabdus furcosa]|uniref:dTTP/UTP pyrophosphatase n=1 Tax=Anaerorhabdus furcosa TaxID=118967 RepID=A0A1T4K1Y1_9FIRM|nr:Maf family protein [Anaerorhabdus furcosa]SJZ36388.1 septum formation protein [Anaerorhabdus furcosa]
MKKCNLILASQSPRRKELMEVIGLPFTIEVADIDETMDLNGDLVEEIKHLAYRKAKVIADKHDDTVVVGADTIVVYNNKVLGKPKNEEDAFAMLKLLSGNTHKVLTGVCIMDHEKVNKYCSISEVTFNNLSDEEIKKYIATKEPMDKAGAYGIQGFGGCFVSEIKGDYYTIMGLPLSLVYQELMKIFS